MSRKAKITLVSATSIKFQEGAAVLSNLEEITAAVQALPMIYQPIFGYELQGAKPLRDCEDRLAYVKTIYDLLSAELGRPLRVLDLACNNGFFSLHAAKWGGVVTGIDIDAKYIRLCNLLASERPSFNVRFIRSEIGHFIQNIGDGEYDLVLCFSVLHWMCQTWGFVNVQAFMNYLSTKVNVGIFEFATVAEQEHSQFVPEDYREFLTGYSFIRVLTYTEIENNDEKFNRPFCFASNKYVYFEALGILRIDDTIFSKYAPEKVCYKCGDKFVRYSKIVDKTDFNRVNNETEFLEEFDGQKGLPKLLATLTEQDEVGLRIFTVRDMLDGITLLEKIKRGEEFDRWNVIKQALEWLIFLKQRGWYMCDIGVNNFLYGDDGKIFLIDYEDIYHEENCFWWPRDLRMRFFIFMNNVLGMNNHTHLLTGIKKYVSSKQYEQIAAIKDTEDFFERLYEILFQSAETETELTAYSMADIEVLKMQEELSFFSGMRHKHDRNFKEINKWLRLVEEQRQRIERLERIINERLK